MYTKSVQREANTMLNKTYLKELIERKTKESHKYLKCDIKESFIASFGYEKWKEELMLERLIPLSIEIAYYLGIEAFPIIFEELNEDARVYINDGYIAINSQYKEDFSECAKCIAHELRHIFQTFYAFISKEAKAKRIREELKNPVELDPADITSITRYCLQEIEIDAYAFTKWYLKKYHNIDVIHESYDYEKIIILYMNKYFK